MLFNKQVTHERYTEVKNRYLELCGAWEPYQTNGNELYKEAGSWDKINMNKFKNISWTDSWKNIPQEAIDYLKTLPEFDAEIFKKITGLDSITKVQEITLIEVCKELGRAIKIKK